MTVDRTAIRQGTRASRLRGVGLAALLAILSAAVLPLLHSATGHQSECAVCGVLAHDGGNASGPAAVQEPTPLAIAASLEAIDPVAVPPGAPLGSSEARAPPSTSLSI